MNFSPTQFCIIISRIRVTEQMCYRGRFSLTHVLTGTVLFDTYIQVLPSIQRSPAGSHRLQGFVFVHLNISHFTCFEVFVQVCIAQK